MKFYMNTKQSGNPKETLLFYYNIYSYEVEECGILPCSTYDEQTVII